MGVISHLTLHNFKSYAGTHSLGPLTHFTAVIGPNGAGQPHNNTLHCPQQPHCSSTPPAQHSMLDRQLCLCCAVVHLSPGKSNILDAISFVLGVRSTQLRGQALADLIHKASSGGAEGTEEEEETKEEKTGPAKSSAGDAYVELVYTLSDDERHSFAGHELFPTPPASLSFRRLIHRSGSSVYRVNGHTLTWERYSGVLELIGVSVRAKNFLVFQGDVESIAQKSAKQYADMIEVSSGSAALREQYEQTQQAMEAESEEFLRLVERVSTIKKERSQIRRQKEEAEEYQQLIAQVKEKKDEFYLWAVYHLCEDIKQKEEEKAQLTDQLDSKQAQQADVHKQASESMAELARRKRQLSEAEKQLTERSRRLEKKRPEHIRLKEEVKHLERRISKEEKELEEFRKRREAQRREVRKIEEDLSAVRAEMERANEEEEQEEEKSREIKLAEGDRREYAELRKRLNEAVSELNERKRALQTTINRQKDAVERLLDLNRELTERRRKEDELRRELGKKAAQLDQQVAEFSKRMDDNKKKRAEHERKTLTARTQRAKMEEELSGLVSQLEEVASRSRDSSRQQRQQDMIELLQKHFPAVRGRLIDLIKPTQKKYNLPVTIALGRHADAIVVDTEKAALECVEYMREQRLGVATFIPLDTVRVKSLSEQLRQLGGSARLLVDVLQFDDDITRALQYAVGSTVVCDTLAEAQRIKFGAADSGTSAKMKIVTVDGTVIHKGGNMTGGHGRQFAEAGRFAEREVEAARSRKDELVRRLADLDSSAAEEEMRAVEAQIGRDTLSHNFIDADRKATAAQLRKKEEDIKDIDGRLLAMQPEIAGGQDELTRNEDELKEVEANIAREEHRVFAAFNRRIGVGSIREYEEGRLQQVEKYSRRKAALAKQETALATALEYERGREEGEAAERKLQQRLEGKRRKLLESRRAAEAREEEIDADKEALNESGDAVKEASLAVDEKTKELKELQKRQAAAAEEVAILEKTLSAVNAALEVIREEMRELLKASRVDNIRLPRRKKRGRQTAKPTKAKRRVREDEDEDDEEDREEEAEDRGDFEMLTEEEEALMMESGDPCATIDFSHLRDNRDTRSSSQRDETRQLYLTTVNDLHIAAEKLAPNLKAFDKYEEVSERLKAASAELDERKEQQKEREAAFLAVKEERRRLFLDCFNHLRSGIQRIYEALTRSPDLPMGGRAMLSLEGDEDEPYLHGVVYRVMPPMKRYMPMDALSGGEKTVASLALIFALHSYKPSPFFVLDEIDAALDNINVQRVSAYVRQRAVVDQLQCVVISLKETFYSKAQALVGIYRHPSNKSSAALTLDLTKYDER